MLPGKNYRNQWADGFQLLHPGTKMVGRAFTAQFMPTRPDIMGALTANATKAGIASYTHQYAIDQLQPGDVFVADLFGKGAEGTHRRRQPVLLRPQGDAEAAGSSSTARSAISRACRTCRCRPTSATRIRRRSAR